jgi:poly(A) polymerase
LALKRDRIIEEVFRAAGQLDVYLVGGLLRNIVLGKPLPVDYDFVFEGDVEALSNKVASRVAGSAFILDKETPLFRVNAELGGITYTIDFSRIKGHGIASDLKGRDFTVDAVALKLSDLFKEDEPALFDPCGGVSDARLGLLKMTSPMVFDEDPLRCLRAVRLSQQYGLEITEETAVRIKSKANLLKTRQTSWERIRDELLLIFSTPETSRSIRALYDLKIMEAVLPEFSGWDDIGGGYDLMAHSLKTLDEAEAFIRGLSKGSFPGVSRKFERHFEGNVGPVGRTALFKMAAFVHDAGKHLTIAIRGGRLRFIGHDFEGSLLTREIFRRLRFSRRLANEVSVLVKNHHRVFALAKLKEPSQRAKAHFFKTVGGEAAVDLLCLALVDARATRGDEDDELRDLVKDMLCFYYDEYLKKMPKSLFNGKEIIKTFSLPEGRLVGEVIEKISEGVETGAVRNKKEAIAFVRQWLSTKEGLPG